MATYKTAVTRVVSDSDARTRLFRTKYIVRILDGPGQRRSLKTAKDNITIGSAEQNDLVLNDPAVSRHHLRIQLNPDGFLLTDLNSTNGTTLGNLKLQEGIAQGPVELQLGETTLQIVPSSEEEEVELVEESSFGEVIGQSPPMRELFRKLKASSPKEVTILLEGETGTGKELIAREIHQHSERRNKPFIIVDCGAIPPTLIESELFGHNRGAFTGAVTDRPGAFEQADGGTIFLDEIGELELTMQPRLLRVLEQRHIKRIGRSRHTPVDVRIIAATNRDLQRDINEGTFRADLFYRLAVVHLRIPNLRQRREDIPPLVKHMLPKIAARVGGNAPQLNRETWQQIMNHPWRGNIRELRNFLERLVALASDLEPVHLTSDLGLEKPTSEVELSQLETLPFKEAKAKWMEAFDIAYLTRLLERCDFNVAEAARQSGIDRVHLFRLVKKYKLRKQKQKANMSSPGFLDSF
ncbi:MAG: sigma 54-interacting transcriptional regulator [Proteobacteria bacterium]|nr:sigma 54-interacting transcriptional regulator [Pseudomonadota bacterium]